jgi:signal transduction histidine kinase
LPAEVRERLFSPHVTTKVEGAGMGLFLARQLIVDMNGGALELSDCGDGGAVATVRVPGLDRPCGGDDGAV